MLPFDPGRDAAAYLAEVGLVHVSVTTGLVLFIFGIIPAAMIVIGIGCVPWYFLKRRAGRIPVVDRWPTRGMNERDRELDVLRLRSTCAALKELGLPIGIAYAELAISAGAVAVAVFLTRDAYF